MADNWVRATRVGVTTPGTGFYGSSHMIGVLPGETVLRVWLNWGGWTLNAPENSYPPGGSLLRVGLCFKPFVDSSNTPVSDPDADWMWMSSFPARDVQLSRATNVAWFMRWGPDQDQSVKAMRKNTDSQLWSLQIGWEFALSGQVTGFQLPFWNASVDALIRNPDASPLDVERPLAVDAPLPLLG